VIRMNASVIICTYNRSHSLLNTLESLEKIAMPENWVWELIIVDNDSSDDTKMVAETFVSGTNLNARYVFEERQGLSSARNRGIKEATGDIVAFSDDDMTFDSHWLFEILAAFEKCPCICVAGKIIPRWPEEKPTWLIDEGPSQMPAFDGRFDLGDQILEIDKHPFGGNMAYKKSAFSKYGLFRTDLGRTGNHLMANEETEFCDRLFAAGEKIVYSPRAVVYHHLEDGQTTKAYWLKRMFNHGRSAIRMKDQSKSGLHRLSVFSLLKQSYRILENVFRWLLTFDHRMRFFHKLRMYRSLGVFTESIKVLMQR